MFVIFLSPTIAYLYFFSATSVKNVNTAEKKNIEKE